MEVNNVSQNVPDQVRQIFEGYLPYGSDFVIFTEQYSNTGTVSYCCLFRRVGREDVSSVRVFRNSPSSDWSVSSVSTFSEEFDGFSVSKPYYCYSNVEGQGRYMQSSTGFNIIPLLVIVLASIAVLRLVFGGITLWSGKSDPY